MLNTIARPFGMLLLWLYDFLGNYGLALIVFAVVVRLILLPFMVKSKKSSLRMTKLQPRINELQKKYAGNQQKLNEEMQKLYRQEGIKPLGGCVWSLIPLPILVILYRAIIYPITTMMNVAPEALAEGGALTTRLAEVGFQAAEKTRYLQIRLLVPRDKPRRYARLEFPLDDELVRPQDMGAGTHPVPAAVP